MKTGRPSTYTKALADFICDELMDGKSLRKICEAEDMPPKTTVMRWLRSNKEFCDQYRIARDIQADAYMDDQVAIADSATTDDWQLKKFQADTRKWVASRLAPKKYGDKQAVEMSGVDGGAIALTLAGRLDAAEKAANGKG